MTRSLTLCCLLLSIPGLALAQVTESEALALGKLLEDHVDRKMGAMALKVSFDLDALAERAAVGVGAPEARVLRFKKAVKEQVGPTLASSLLRNADHYHLLRFVAEGQPRLLFRVADAEFTGLAYQELYLDKVGGELKVVDAFLHVHGETLSDKLRAQFVAGLGGGATVSKELLAVHEAWSARRVPETLAAIERCSVLERARLDVLLIRLQASTAEPKLYDATIEEILRRHPRSTTALIARIEREVGAKNHPRALQAIDALDAVVRDPFMDYRRSLVHLAAGDRPAAMAAMRRALQRDPRLRLEEKAPAKPKPPVAQPKGDSLAGKPFNVRMGAVDRAHKAGDYATALLQARALKESLLKSEGCDPTQLGWAHYYEFRSLFGLQRWQEALDLIEAKLPVPYLISTRNTAFMYSVGGECASQLGDAKRCLELMCKCISARLACDDPKNARVAVDAGITLLARCKRRDLGPKLVEHLLDVAGEGGNPAHLERALFEASVRQMTSAQAGVTRRVSEGFDGWVELGRKGPAGVPLLRRLAEIERSSWFLSTLSPPDRGRRRVAEALWIAAQGGDAKEVKVLLKKGANPDHLNLAQPERLTPLMAAAAEGHDKVVRLLVKKANLEERTPQGRTALHLACGAGHDKAVRHLIKAGADQDAKDHQGKTCTDVAAKHPKILRLLR